MRGSFESLNGMLGGGSRTSFKKMERGEYSDAEREIDLENRDLMQEGIRLLRKIRTSALEAKDQEERQKLLTEAHELSDRMAETILVMVSEDLPKPIEAGVKDELAKLGEAYKGRDADSGHGIPSQYSIQNLLAAAEDILVRINETAVSFKAPDHQLNREEVEYVLGEFLKGTNGLNKAAIEAMFAEKSKVGGILSGGAVYADMAKKIIERYGEPPMRIQTFVIAVNKDEKKIVAEHSDGDAEIDNVILVDDMIDGGGTMLTALRAVGEYFPNATIRSEKDSDAPGAWKERHNAEYMTHLFMLFQDFADFVDAGKKEEALGLFAQAEEYARQNNVELTRGWHIRKAKLEK